MRQVRYLALVAALILVVGACSDDDAGTTTDAPPATEAPATTQAPATTAAPATTVADDDHDEGEEDDDHDEGEEDHDEAGFQLDAPAAAITVDLDISDWDAVPGLDLTLEGIESESVDSKDVTLKVAHDDEFLYVLISVEDDYNWSAEDSHLSAATAVLWAIDDGAGPHMGTEAEGEEEEYVSLGMVDIWLWHLECGFGEESGGSVSGADDGNDPGCNFDDEYATDPETREDDGADGEAGAENSLLGVWMHTNPVADGDGTWYFEMSRPLQTGDAQDAQFAVGQSALLALAYWDADNSPDGWEDAEHVQSSSLGWIEVTLVG